MSKPITERQALAKACKMFGKNACTRFNPKASTDAERAKWRAMTKEQIAALTPEQKKERQGDMHGYRCTIGKIVTIAGLMAFNEVQGQGDTWELALEEAERRRAAERERWAKLKAS